MSTQDMVRIICDHCPENVRDSITIPCAWVSTARLEAIRHGWSYHDGTDHCPQHNIERIA